MMSGRVKAEGVCVVLAFTSIAVAQSAAPRTPGTGRLDGVQPKVWIAEPEVEPAVRCGEVTDSWQRGLETRKLAYRKWARDMNLDKWARRGQGDLSKGDIWANYKLAELTSSSAIVGYVGHVPVWSVPWTNQEWPLALRAELAPVFNLENDSDMGVNGWIRVLYRDREERRLPDFARNEIGRALKSYKYWVDEAGPEDTKRAQIFWSENHQAMYATAELLAGQLFPNEAFRDTQRGSAHRLKAATRLRRWLDERLKYGFSEWNSPVYYEYEIMPLLNLVDFSEDREIAARAAMVLDLLFFDLARFTQRGSFGVTAGRVYGQHKTAGWVQSVGDTIQILFGTRGQHLFTSSPSAHALASTSKYCVPSAILAIGQDQPQRFVDRSRVGVNLHELPGVGFTSDDDAFFWWSKNAYFVEPMVPKSNSIISKYRLEHQFAEDFAWVRSIPTPAGSGADLFSVFFEGMALTRANLYTYRDSGAMLSSVQGYHPGQVGPQSSAWQVAVDNNVHVFGTYPAARSLDSSPSWWTGSAVMPFVAQKDSAAIAVYAPDPISAQAVVFGHRTHLWFPFASSELPGLYQRAGPGRFDEVRAVHNHSSNDLKDSVWFFGRKAVPGGEGYVGVYSAQPCKQVTTGTWAGKEIVCEGLRNAFVVQVGSDKNFGSFDNFVQACSRARIFVGAGIRSPMNPLVDKLVNFDSPDPVLVASKRGTRLQVDYGSGEVRFANVPMDIRNFPRFENSYTQTPWGAGRYRIGIGDVGLTHDLTKSTRAGEGLGIRPFVGVFPAITYEFETLYGVQAGGSLLWHRDRIGVESFSAADQRERIQGERAQAQQQRDVQAPATPATGGGLSARTRSRERANLEAPNRLPVGDRPVGAAGSAAAGKEAVAPWVVKPLPAHKLTHELGSAKEVASGWSRLQAIIPAGGSSLYKLGPDGVLQWWKHTGFNVGEPAWQGPVNVGTGWNTFIQIVGGGEGVLYAIKPDGRLLWYRHMDAENAATQPRWSGPAVVGSGWTTFKHAFSTGEGVVYGIKPDGVLLWYRHKGFLDGAPTWDGPIQVGTGWQDFKDVFSPGKGRIYAITQDGTLLCYQHNGYWDGTLEWQGPVTVGSGWADLRNVFPLMWSSVSDAIRLH